MKHFIVIIFIISSISSCNADNRKHSDQGISEEKKEIDVIKPSPKIVMDFLYSNYDSKTKKSIWNCNERSILEQFKEQDSTLFISKLLFLDSLMDGNNKKLYVITEFRPMTYECHSCSPMQEITIFGKENNKWKQEYRSAFSQIGNWGVSPQFTTKKIGTNKTAFFFTPGYTIEGLTTENVVAFGVFNGEIRKILEIENAYMDNEGICDTEKKDDCWKYEYKVKIPDSKRDLYDIFIERKGKYKQNDTLVEIDSVERYEFINGSYMKK